MVASLSPANQLKLQQVLSQWQRWKGAVSAQPQPMQVLDGGRSNTSIRVGSGDRCWVVRLDGFDPQRLGLSRSAEWRALQQAAARQLAPTPVYANPELGALVCEFQQSDEGRRADNEIGQDIADIAQLLRAIHTLPAIKFRLDPMTRARRYLQLAGDDQLATEFVQACARLERQAITPLLCHNDLLRANRLRSAGRLLALDWEYVAMGDPLFELAVVIEGDGLTQAQASSLHEQYLDSIPSRQQQLNLQDQRAVYCELTRLWQGIQLW